MQETSKERKRESISSHQSSFPRGAGPLVASIFCCEAEKTTLVGQRASLHPASNSLLPADLGFLHRAQVGVVDEVLLPVPAPRQGGVLLQDRGVLLLGARVIL